MPMPLKNIAISAFISGTLLLSSATSFAQTPAQPLSKADVEAIVKQVIHDNPELILQSVADYQRKKQDEASTDATKNVSTLQDKLLNDPMSPVAGNPRGDVTVVEFFDYHCGYCKRFVPVLSQLLGKDNNVRMVFKEFPILSDDSGLAAKAALAVYQVDKSKYLAFHTSLMEMSGEFTMDNLTEKAKAAGISAKAFKKAMQNPALDKEIEQNKELASSLNIHGTPTLIIGHHIVPGLIQLSDLESTIASVRNKK